MKIAIIGAGGFVGNLLVTELAKIGDNDILAISLDAKNIVAKTKNIKKQSCDVLDINKLGQALKDYPCVYYLIHSMASGSKKFPLLEKAAVKSFCQAAKNANVKKVIYLGGLGDESQNLSKHLASRHNVGAVLRSNFTDVIEFRASIIIGKGSVSAETIKQIVDKINFMILPGWANTLTQPIYSSDVIEYLIEATNQNLVGHRVYEIGGPMALTYKDCIKSYANSIDKKVHILVVNHLPKVLIKYLIGYLIEDKIKNTASSMVESLDNQMIVTNKNAIIDFPNIKPKTIDYAFQHLLKD